MKIDRYVWEGRAEHLLALLQRAHAEDETAETLRSRFTTLGCLGAVATIAAFIAAFNLGVVWLWAVPLALLAVVILVFRKAGRHARHDLDDRKVASARRVVSVLRADVPATWPIGLEVDFRPYQEGGAVLESTGGRSGVRSAKYAQDWLILRANLADGTSVVATLTDRVSRKEKPKRKRTKVAETFATRGTVTLRLAKRLGAAEAAAARLGGTAPRNGWSVLSLTGRGRMLSAVVAPPPGRKVQNRTTTESGMDQLVNGDTLLQTLSWLYGGAASASPPA